MGRPERIGLIAVGLVLVAGVPIHFARGAETETPIIGVVRATEVGAGGDWPACLHCR
jgi:hypothetical protein